MNIAALYPNQTDETEAVSTADAASADMSQMPEGYPAEKWSRMSAASRDAVLRTHAAIRKRGEAIDAELNRPKGQGASKFTTAYAIEWGRAQGWRLVDRERWIKDWRASRGGQTKLRSLDVDFGMDAIFVRGDGTRVGVQGAGKSERAEHYRRFEQRGAIPESRDRYGRVVAEALTAEQVAKAQAISIFYVEFERGNKVPILIEQWA